MHAAALRSRGQSRDETTQDAARAGRDHSSLASDVLGDARGDAIGVAPGVAPGDAPGDAHGYAYGDGHCDAQIDSRGNSLSDFLEDAHDASSISTKKAVDCTHGMMLATAQALSLAEDTCGETGTNEDGTLIAGTVCEAQQAAPAAPVLDAVTPVPTGSATCASSTVQQPASLVELCEKRLLRYIRCSQDGKTRVPTLPARGRTGRQLAWPL
jgi:hypothetical protein